MSQLQQIDRIFSYSDDSFSNCQLPFSTAPFSSSAENLETYVSTTMEEMTRAADYQSNADDFCRENETFTQAEMVYSPEHYWISPTMNVLEPTHNAGKLTHNAL